MDGGVVESGGKLDQREKKLRGEEGVHKHKTRRPEAIQQQQQGEKKNLRKRGGEAYNK